MGKVKNEIEKIYRICERLYTAGGVNSVIAYINAAIEQGNELIIQNVRYERCDACDSDMPSINHVCLICGQDTKLTKQQLVDAVIEDLKESMASGDYTVLDELLHFIPNKNLIQALPEERWKEFEDLNKDYFNVTHTGFEEASQREEIRIHAGENANIVMYQDGDKLGFIVDVYGQDDIVNTMTVWEEDLTSNDEEEQTNELTDDQAIEDFGNFLERHAGEIKGLYDDKYWRNGGWNGMMDALSDVEKRHKYNQPELPDGEFERLVNEYLFNR